MKVIFLGTGTSVGIPMIACNCAVCLSSNPKDKRLRSTVLVEVNSKKILIDAGPDIRTQLLRSHVQDIDALLITHYHKDHIGGLDDLRAITMLQHKKIPIFGKADVLEAVQREIPYAFGDKAYKLSPKFELIEILPQQSFTAAEQTVIPIEVQHGDLDITGFRVGYFSYITDANKIVEREQSKIKNSRCFVVNGIRHEKHGSHFSLGEAIEISQKVDCPKTYITHISHQLGKHDEVNSSLPPKIQLAYDGMEIMI